MQEQILSRGKVLDAVHLCKQLNPGVTFVVGYGDNKPHALWTYVESVQAELTRHLSEWFQRGWIRLRPVESVHFTLIGIESSVVARDGDLVFINKLRSARAKQEEDTREVPPIDVERLVRLLRQMLDGLDVRLGGWEADYKNPIEPEKQPYRCTFAINRNGHVLSIGFPIREERIQPILADFRIAAESCEVVGKTTMKRGTIDNNMYAQFASVTAGCFDEGSNAERERFQQDLETAQENIRVFLSKNPFSVHFSAEHFSLVRYQTTDLQSVTRILPLSELTVESFWELYGMSRLVRSGSGQSGSRSGSAKREEVARAVYVVFENCPLGEAIRQFWHGKSNPNDTLHRHFKASDLGEALGFGEWPHATVLDSLTTYDPDAFDAAVKTVCLACAKPTLDPMGISLMRSGEVVAIKWTSQSLVQIRAALIAATDHLIVRHPLSDEEIQRSLWAQQDEKVRRTLEEVARRYVAAGRTPLPSSRFFRHNFLIQQTANLLKAEESLKMAEARTQGQEAMEAKDSAERHLNYFYTTGRPHWYAGADSWHVTLVSGFTTPPDEKVFKEALWSEIKGMVDGHQPESLGILTEDPGTMVPVSFRDEVIGKVVQTQRPGFMIVDRAPFA